MKNHTVIAIAVLVLMLALSLVLSGCDHKPEPAADDRPVAAAFLIGNHANSRLPNTSSPAFRETVSSVIKSYGYIVIISVDGEPSVVLEGSCDIDERYKHAAEQKLTQDCNSRTGEILSRSGQVRADSPEVDTLAAIRLATRSLTSAPADSEKIMFIADSGVNTTGLCDLTNNLLCGAPQVIADALYEQRAIPDLTGITIKWQNLGDVAAPQALSPRQVEQLTALWRAIVEKGGGSFQLEDAPPLSDKPDPDLPAVSVVQLAAEAPLSFKPELAVGQTFSFAEPLMFTEKQFRFEPDSADLLDREEAEDALRPIAEYIEAHPELSLLLAGTTAGDEESEYNRRLSLSRAMTVKDILVSFGVAEEQLIVRGLGNSDPWHIWNVGTQGELAAQNRKVVLLDAASEAAQAILVCSDQEPPS